MTVKSMEERTSTKNYINLWRNIKMMKVICKECGREASFKQLVNGIHTDRKGNNLDIACVCGHLMVRAKKVPQNLKRKRVFLAGTKSSGVKTPF